MKKLGVVISLLVLISFLPGVIGCGPTAPITPTTPTTPTTPITPTTPTKAESFKPIKLKYADYRAHKPGYFKTTSEMESFLKAVEAVTNGRIVMEPYPTGSLLALPQMETGIAQGVADIGYSGRAVAGVMPMKDVMTMPPLQGETTAVENLMIYWFILYDKLVKDTEALNLIDLGPLTLHATLIVTAKKPVRTVADIKGVTLISTRKWDLRLAGNLGATTLPISNLDGADALAKGMIDGGIWNWEGPALFGWWDYFKPGYYVDVGGFSRTGGSSNALMNLQKFNSLPKDLQETLAFVAWRWAAVYFASHIDATVKPFMKEAEKRGIQYIVWSDEEKAKFAKEKTKIIDEWIGDMEKLYKRGAEAAELVKMYNEAASKYVPSAPIPTQPQLGSSTKAEWDAVFGPGSTWGMNYKAYPNQTGLRKLDGNEFKAWPK